MDALEAFRVPLPTQDPTPSEYLLDKSSGRDAYDVALQVEIKGKGAEKATVVSKSNLKVCKFS
jgi:fumarylacetoacetase